MRMQIERLVSCFEGGALTRRDLIAGLVALCSSASLGASAAPAAGGAAAHLGVGTQSKPEPPQAKEEPIPVSGFDHLALRVADLPRSIAFYRDHLGGKITSQSSNAAFLDVGEHWIALFGRGARSTGFPATEPGVDHISFHSTQHRSLDERMGVLRAHRLDPSSPAGSNRVYFRDPDGVILQLS
ncbi:MAG: VOC family protein [Candidatus Acidiferrales bacterium]